MDNTQGVEALRQIGANLLAISGGRARLVDGTLVLPVGSGYTVEVDLDPSDTYTVRRVFSRGTKRWVKGEVSDVYAEQLSEVAYEAHAFRSYDFPQEVSA